MYVHTNMHVRVCKCVCQCVLKLQEQQRVFAHNSVMCEYAVPRPVPAPAHQPTHTPTDAAHRARSWQTY